MPPALRRISQQLGFAIYRASHDDYQDSILPNGQLAGSPEDALGVPRGFRTVSLIGFMSGMEGTDARTAEEVLA
jgi:hypothetical protein